MTARPSEHNGGPPIVDRTFKRRWAQAILDHPDKPVGAVAVAFKLYVDSDCYGRGAVATDAEIARATGTSDRSVRNFKAWLVREHLVEVIVRGGRGGKSEFVCTIPGENAPALNRQNLPVKGVIKPALISGKNRLNRQHMPDEAPVQPAKSAGEATKAVYPATISGKKRPDADAIKERSPHTPLKENNTPPRTTVESYNSASSYGSEVAAKIDHKKLEAFLLDACNGALANPAAAPGLMNLGTPMWWIEQGADLHRDILPTLREKCAKLHGKNIASWSYFDKPIADAVARRRRSLAEMADPEAAVPVSPEMERNRRINEMLRAKREAQQRRG